MDQKTKRFGAAMAIIAGAGLVGALLNPAADPGFLIAAIAALLISLLRPIRRMSVIAALVAGALMVLFLALLTPLARLPALWLYGPFLLLWPWLAAARANIGWPAPLKAAAGLLIFLAFFELLLQIGFNLLPGAIRYRMPQMDVRSGIRFDTEHGAREYPAGQEVRYTIDGRTGDLYELTCLPRPKAPRFEPYQVQFIRDAHGFRNPTPWPDEAALVVVGDSFTAGEAVQRPFWQDITPSVFALGLPGSGTLEQLLLLRAYGLARRPEVVVMAYFGGNDMIDTWHFHETRAAGENLYTHALPQRVPLEYVVSFRLLHWLSAQSGGEACRYPIEDTRGHALAFFAPFFTGSTIPAAALRESSLFAHTRNAILAAAGESQSQGAAFALMYLPYKAQTYWPLLSDAQRAAIGEDVRLHALSPQDVPAADLLAQHMDAQRALLGELAGENGFLYLDLTPHFREAAEAGEQLYFYGDTHWNQNGHDLARTLLRRFLHAHDLLEE